MKKYCLVLLVFSICTWSSCKDETNNAGGCTVDDFTGQWNMHEQCDSGSYQYQISISQLSSGIRISNIGDSGTDAFVDATVEGSTFTFTPQAVQGYILHGNGSLNAGCSQLTWSWEGGLKGGCAGTATK